MTNQCRRTVTIVYLISESRRLGRALGEERRRQGLTRNDVAAQARVSRGWMVGLEAGRGTAQMDTVFRVITALGLTMTLATVELSPEDHAGQSAFESISND